MNAVGITSMHQPQLVVKYIQILFSFSIIILILTCFYLVDVTVYHRGFHGDLNETLLIGNASEAARKLTQNTWECLQKAIQLGNPLFQPNIALKTEKAVFIISKSCEVKWTLILCILVI